MAKRPGALLVRDVMTIGVPVCRDDEACGRVAARLAPGSPVVVLDEDGVACGWIAYAQLLAHDPARPAGEIMDEDIPTVPPDIPAETAAQLMRDRGVGSLFLMHAWPGEPRPSAVVSLEGIQQRLAAADSGIAHREEVP